MSAFGGKADIGRTGAHRLKGNWSRWNRDRDRRCMPGNADDASYARARRPCREETESERGLHDEPRYNKRDREHQGGDERRP